MTAPTLEYPPASRVQSNRRLTARELEQMTQPLYERSLQEMKAEGKRRFNAERVRTPKKPK